MDLNGHFQDRKSASYIICAWVSAGIVVFFLRESIPDMCCNLFKMSTEAANNITIALVVGVPITAASLSTQQLFVIKRLNREIKQGIEDSFSFLYIVLARIPGKPLLYQPRLQNAQYDREISLLIQSSDDLEFKTSLRNLLTTLSHKKLFNKAVKHGIQSGNFISEDCKNHYCYSSSVNGFHAEEFPAEKEQLYRDLATILNKYLWQCPTT
ncbi:MAG: hypothetical protein FVQ81_06015 [Candidatus Glassbacteria bacterium]|nr:hypothetical protein [Candidatus Glassbacteria bacterium]